MASPDWSVGATRRRGKFQAALVLLAVAGGLALILLAGEASPGMSGRSDDQLPVEKGGERIAASPDSDSELEQRIAELMPDAVPELPPAQLNGIDGIDEEWSAFSRHPGSLLNRIHSPAMATMTPSKLFRNPELNPRDKYLAPGQRGRLEVYADQYLKVLGAAYAAALNDRHAEWDSLIENGSLQPLILKDDQQTQDEVSRIRQRAASHGLLAALDNPKYYKASKGIVWVRTMADGRVFGLRFSDLNQARASHMAAWRLSEDFAANVVSWFRSVGCLTDFEASSLLSSCFQERPPR